MLWTLSLSVVTSSCPQCRASPLVTQDSLFMKCKLRQQHIYCINKDRWTEVGTPYPVNPCGSHTTSTWSKTCPGLWLEWRDAISPGQPLSACPGIVSILTVIPSRNIVWNWMWWEEELSSHIESNILRHLVLLSLSVTGLKAEQEKMSHQETWHFTAASACKLEYNCAS